MVTVIVSHEVTNFAEWKKGFQANEPSRVQAGLKSVGLFTSVENANYVTIVMEAPSVEAVKGMMGNPEFQETMKKAGVIGIPEVKLLNKA
ncbi:MAG: hypothetical protein V4714_19305 [Bacteroidota bacterium]